GFEEVLAIFFLPATALMKDDFPTLDLPLSAISASPVSGYWSGPTADMRISTFPGFIFMFTFLSEKITVRLNTAQVNYRSFMRFYVQIPAVRRFHHRAAAALPPGLSPSYS